MLDPITAVTHSHVNTAVMKTKEMKEGAGGGACRNKGKQKVKKKTKREKPDGSRMQVKESGKREAEGRINASSISGKGEIMTWLGMAP